MNLEKLAARVRAVNRANACAARLYTFLEPVFLPLIGQKILRKDGRILAKIRLRPFVYGRSNKRIDCAAVTEEDDIISVAQAYSTTDLVFTVDTCESWGDTCFVRHAVEVKIGELCGQFLVSMPYGNTLYKQYDFDTVRSALELAEKAEKIYKDALSMCEVFIGE